MFTAKTGTIVNFATRFTLIAFAGLILAGCCSKPRHTKEVHYREEGEVIESTTPIVD